MTDEPRSADLIFDAAIQHTAGPDRVAYLDQACDGQPQLRHRVEMLLRAHDEAGSFLEAPATNLSPTIIGPVAEQAGDRIGPYKLLQQIGEGGMGVVYMAEQSEPIKRRVALKIIKPGKDTREVIARFEAERQALAMMDHPNVAKVYDGGATESGRPYFVMDLINGLPLTKYCDEHHLTLRERLELFVPICQAVQHAHQKGIIHRDLKPSNILVAIYDGYPVPKVIDFGVAKAINHLLTEKTVFTRFGQAMGTLEYMSPEQAERNQLDIDTRSDVYSLGVVLYELLTGDTPFDRQRLRLAAIDEMLRIIREEEPPRPSTKLSGSKTLPSVAASRHVAPCKLPLLLRRELDWIVMKAIEKDRARRYETANAFAMDVQRFLTHEPVEARPPSTGYQLKKFARKHKSLLLTAAGFAAVLVLATAISTWLAIRARQAEAVAITERGDAAAARDAEAEARKEVEAERDKTREVLRRSLLQQARALRQSMEYGSRQRALDALAHASQIRPGPDLRSEFIRCLELAELARASHAPYPNTDDALSKRSRDAIRASRDPDAIASVRNRSWSYGTFTFSNSSDSVIIIPSEGRPVECAIENGETIRLLVDIPEVTHPFALSSDRQLLAARKANETGTFVFNIDTGQSIGELTDAEGNPIVPFLLAFDHGTQRLAVAPEQLSWGRSTILIYDIPSLRLVNTWKLDLDHIDCLCFHPNNEILAASIGDAAHTIALWRISDGERIATLQLDRRDSWVSNAKPQRIDFSSNGHIMAAGGQTGVVKAWDLSSLVSHDAFRRDSRFAPRELFLASLHAGLVSSVQISPDGYWLATVGEDEILRVWQLSTGQLAAQAPVPMHAAGHLFSLMQWSESGNHILCNMSDGLRLWKFIHPESHVAQYGATSDQWHLSLEFNPLDDLLAVSQDSGTHLIDLVDQAATKLIDFVKMPASMTSLRTYPKTPARLNVMQAHANCKRAK